MTASNRVLALIHKKEEIRSTVQVLRARSLKYESERLQHLISEIEKVVEEIQLPERPPWQKIGDFEITLDTPINRFSRDNLWKSFWKTLSRRYSWEKKRGAHYWFEQFTNMKIYNSPTGQEVSPSLDSFYDSTNECITVGELLAIRTYVKDFITEHKEWPYRTRENKKSKSFREIDPFLDWVIPQIVSQ